MNQRTALDIDKPIAYDMQKTHIELIKNLEIDLKRSVRYLTLITFIAIVGTYSIAFS